MKFTLDNHVVGYYRPVKKTPRHQSQWNPGKREEFKERVEFDPAKSSAPGNHYPLMTTLRGEGD